jgi:hypothetical protein
MGALDTRITDQTRFRAVVPARFGDLAMYATYFLNETTDVLTVPASHKYLIHTATVGYALSSAAARMGYLILRRAGNGIFYFLRANLGAAIQGAIMSIPFSPPLEMIAADFIRGHSSGTTMEVFLGVYYEDVTVGGVR